MYTHDRCRLCRWAHSRKYGLGWSHEKQNIEPVMLSRETCVNGLLQSPAVESWWSDDGNGGGNIEIVQPVGYTNESVAAICPLPRESVAQAKIEPELIRSVWSHDGATDIYLEGTPANSYVLRLEFPLKEHGPLRIFDSRTAWIQDDLSRISIIIDARVQGSLESVITVKSGRWEINVEPGFLPMRIRLVIENQDVFHEGASKWPTYYGAIMSEDMVSRPEMFCIGTGKHQSRAANNSQSGQNLQPKGSGQAKKEGKERTKWSVRTQKITLKD